MKVEKKYGDEDFGSTLEELQKQAIHAQDISGVNFEGDARKVGAILTLAGVGGELIAEIQELTAQRDEMLKALSALVYNTTDYCQGGYSQNAESSHAQAVAVIAKAGAQ